jgi:hypothetical protein
LFPGIVLVSSLSPLLFKCISFMFIVSHVCNAKQSKWF